ncbi:uncharacterized protein LOC134334722 isoform X2 [Trichomycterus rosablanca]|uniref:uncharacterized protein LOC134334722 isoform X2 n=1 Tax=Trichomycterus rosablanca TaxID=2290929 RepID=UPI002F352AE8
MEFRDLLEEFNRLQDQVEEMRREILIRNSKSTSDDQLHQMEQQQREHLAIRCSSLIEKGEAYEKTQEGILRRICGPDESLPETKGFPNLDYIKPSPPVEKPNRGCRVRRNVGTPKMASRFERFPSRHKGRSGFEMEMTAMQAHVQEEAEIAAYNAREISRTVRCTLSSPRGICSPVDTSTPTELRFLPLSAIRTPAPSTPASPVIKSRPNRSRIPRLQVLTEITKARRNGDNSAPVNWNEIASRMSALTKKWDVPLRSADSMLKDRATQREMAARKPAAGPPKRSQDDRLDPAEKPTPLDGSLQKKQGRVKHVANVSTHKVNAGRDGDEAEDAAGSNGRRETSMDLDLVSEKPLDRPEVALNQVFQLLELEDWERKIEGLKVVRALAEHHSNVILPRLHEVCLCVIQEVKNLRSMVSRAAMTTLAHLYAHLQRAMDPELDGTALVLLHKAGESSQFVKEDADMALNAMVIGCSPARVLNALLAGGLK